MKNNAVEELAWLPGVTKKESFVKPKHSKGSRTLFGVRWLDTAFFLSNRAKRKNETNKRAGKNATSPPGIAAFILRLGLFFFLIVTRGLIGCQS